MGKLVESTWVTLDGVVSSPENWAGLYHDLEQATYAHNLLFAADALLLGRVTYELFVRQWSDQGGRYAERINAIPKYVASRTLHRVGWNATVINDDIVGTVVRLKERFAGDLLKLGTGLLDATLIHNRLVDEFHFWVLPVLAGRGAHLMDGIVGVTHLRLIRTMPLRSGVVVHTYVPT